MTLKQFTKTKPIKEYQSLITKNNLKKIKLNTDTNIHKMNQEKQKKKVMNLKKLDTKNFISK